MVEWEYRWRTTYWDESERSDGYVQWVSYRHVWKPDRENVAFYPDDDGLNLLGKDGWELVAVTPSQVSLLTRISPQQGDSYSPYTICTLIFKRPLQGEAQAHLA